MHACAVVISTETCPLLTCPNPHPHHHPSSSPLSPTFPSPTHHHHRQVFWLTSVCFPTSLLRPQRATSMADVARDAHVVGCSAWRRRNRRLRAFWRHEQHAVRMAVAVATHHSYDRSSAHAGTQTDLEYVTPAPVIECVAPAPTCSDLCCAQPAVTSCLHHDNSHY